MKKNPATKTRISKLTVGRLYNLGNYEHVRYELTVDIEGGQSARETLHKIMLILKAANPKPPVQQHELKHAESQLSDPMAWHKNITNKKEQRQARKLMVKDAKATIARYNEWKKARKTALAIMDDLGGTRVFKDHKDDWNDDDQW